MSAERFPQKLKNFHLLGKSQTPSSSSKLPPPSSKLPHEDGEAGTCRDFEPFAVTTTVGGTGGYVLRVGRAAEAEVAEGVVEPDLAADELLASAPAETAFFSVIPKTAWSQRRCARFRERMHEAKVPFRFLKYAEDIVRLKKPAAVFAANDMSAAALLSSATRCGLECPRDFTLVSVDNEPLFCENAKPKVTSIEQDFAGAGLAAAKALDRLSRRCAGSPATILVPPRRLVRRASSVRPHSGKTIAQKVAVLVNARAIDGITVADIAKLLGYSRRTVETNYRAAYGHGIGEAIFDCRFKEVERLLAGSRQQLGAIANMCGWKSSAGLARAFRERYGMTMTEWRTR